jgi:hypothetical protein
LGWGEHANTWEPPDNLVGVPEIIEAFEKGYSLVLLYNVHILFYILC